MSGGIYQWRQLSTQRKYIGSTVDFELRKVEHLAGLFIPRLTAGINPKLYAAFREAGRDDFVFEVLEVFQGTREELYAREQWYLDNVIDWERDFNIARFV